MEVAQIKIQLNGEAREVPEHLTVASLLEWLKLPADRVAVERNLQIVARDRWKETPVQPGDRLEVVHFVGGGQPLPSWAGESKLAPRQGLRLRASETRGENKAAG